MINQHQKNFIIVQLRRIHFRWPNRSKAKAKAKVKIGEFSTGKPKFAYKCSKCGGLFKEKEVQLDHVQPVVPVEGYKSGKEFDVEEYICRLLCDVDDYQVLCVPCHQEKSAEENSGRADCRKLKAPRKVPAKTTKIKKKSKNNVHAPVKKLRRKS